VGSLRSPFGQGMGRARVIGVTGAITLCLSLAVGATALAGSRPVVDAASADPASAAAQGAAKSGVTPTTGTVSAASASTASAQAAASAKAGAVALSGTVRFNGVPQAGVKVSAGDGIDSVTGSDGVYTVTNITPGYWRLTATPGGEGAATTWFPSYGEAKKSMPVLIDATTVGSKNWDFRLASTSASATASATASAKAEKVSISGTVRLNGVPQAGVKVSLGDGVPSVTGADGVYTVTGITPGYARGTASSVNGDAAFVETWFPSYGEAKKSMPVLIDANTAASGNWDFRLAPRNARLFVMSPWIYGDAKVGGTLNCATRETAGAAYSIQWYVNGKPISRATTSSLKVARAYRGKDITVQFTFSKAGYDTVTKTSFATRIN
jgi:hypothetical protein